MIKRLKNMSFAALSVILIVITALTCIGGYAVFTQEPQIAFADDEDEAEDTSTMSFYSIASSYARIIGYIASPDYSEHSGGDDKRVEKNIATWNHVVGAAGILNSNATNVGTAASLLGYFDAGDGGGFFGWLQTLASGTSTTYNYDSLHNYPNLSSSVSNAMFSYGAYGYGLSLMGFDETAGSSLGLIRILSGSLFFLSFVVAFAVDFIFRAVLFVLKGINVFALFSNVGEWVGFGNIDGTGNAFGSSLITMISSLYEAIAGLSVYVLIPVFIALCAFTFLVLRKTDAAKGKLKKIVIRIIFVVAGIPLLAMMYTSSLDKLGDISTSATNAADITFATFVDFNAWVYKSQLKPADALSFSYNSGSQTIDLQDGMYIQLQDYCYSLNRANGIIAMPTNTYAVRGGGNSRLESSLGQKLTPAASSNAISSGFSECVGLITRYMTSSKMTSSDYESYIKKNITSNSDVSKFFNGLRRVRYEKYDPDKDDAKSKFGMFSKWDGSANKSGDASDTVFDVSFRTSSVGLPSAVNIVSGSLTGSASGSGVTINASGSLSPLGTYNYLNTFFEEKSMTVYSPSNASSLFVMRQHYQVNMIGTGFLSFMYWLNAVVQLWCLSLLGFTYGFGILFGNLKRGFKILAQVPFAVLGAMKSIARVISWTVMMIIEIMVTLFLYQILSEVFLYIPRIIASPMVDLMQGRAPTAPTTAITLPGTDLAIGGYMLTVLILLLSMIAEVLFVIMAIKLRKQVVNAVDEEAARVIEQIVGVGPGAASELPDQPGPFGNMASNALAAGAMSKAMDSMSGGQGAGAAFEKATEAGEDAVRHTVGTGDGSEEDEEKEKLPDGQDARAGESAESNSAADNSVAEGNETNVTSAEQNAKNVMSQVVSQGGLSGSRQGDNIVENNETNITNEGDTETSNDKSTSNQPVDINDADVNRIRDSKSEAKPDKERVSEGKAESRSEKSEKPEANKVPLAKGGEGGKGGDGKKGEDGRDGKDAQPSKDSPKSEVKNARAGAIAPEPGVYANAKGKLFHADGTPLSKAETKAYNAEQKAIKAQSEPMDAKRTAYAQKAMDAQAGANVERAKADKPLGVLKDISDARTSTVQGLDKTKQGYQENRKDVRANSDAARARNRQRDSAANERAYQARIATAFPYAVDAKGQFHPEALNVPDRAKLAVMQASHNIATGAVNTAQKATDAGRNVARKGIDKAVTGSIDIGKSVVSGTATAAEKTVDATAGKAYRAQHGLAAFVAQQNALTSMKRSRTYIPGIGEKAQPDQDNSVKQGKAKPIEKAETASAGTAQAARNKTPETVVPVRGSGSTSKSKTTSRRTETVENEVQVSRVTNDTIKSGGSSMSSGHTRGVAPVSSSRGNRSAQSAFIKNQMKAAAVESIIGGNTGAAIANGIRMGSTVGYARHMSRNSAVTNEIDEKVTAKNNVKRTYAAGANNVQGGQSNTKPLNRQGRQTVNETVTRDVRTRTKDPNGGGEPVSVRPVKGGRDVSVSRRETVNETVTQNVRRNTKVRDSGQPVPGNARRDTGIQGNGQSCSSGGSVQRVRRDNAATKNFVKQQVAASVLESMGGTGSKMADAVRMGSVMGLAQDGSGEALSPAAMMAMMQMSQGNPIVRNAARNARDAGAVQRVLNQKPDGNP